MSDDNLITLCDGGDGTGCGGIFARKSSAGLCAKCSKLASLVDPSDEFARWQAMKQCQGCGMAWQNMSGNLCGRCSSVSNAGCQPAKPMARQVNENRMEFMAQTAVDVARTARAHAMDARVNKLPAAQPPPLHTSAGLAAAKANHRSSDHSIMINIACRVKGESKRQETSTDSGCGHWGKPWSRDAFLSEVLEHSLQTLNTDWAQSHGLDLALDEVQLRFSQNYRLLGGSACDTVGNVYDTYMTGDMAALYNNKKTKKAGMREITRMDMELHIDKEKYLKRLAETKRSILTESCSLAVSTIATRKRSATTTGPSDDHVAKRHAGDTLPLQSSFIRSSRPPIPGSGASRSVKITLQRAKDMCDAQTGQVEVSWMDDAESEEGVLGVSVYGAGATKKVYPLSIGRSLLVAKRFFDIGQPTSDDVSAEQNESALQNELIRLKMVSWFLDKFKSHAKIKSIEIAQNVQVSDAFLIREKGLASLASGLLASNDAAVWLVEPRRTKTVFKYSGTLVFPNRRNDKMGMTLHAFSHFVYDFSHKSLVVADVQGLPMNVNGQETIILFDIMTHSPTGDSGIGDFGMEGINAFLGQHKCNITCLGLKLSPMATSTANNNEDDQGPEDEPLQGEEDDD